MLLRSGKDVSWPHVRNTLLQYSNWRDVVNKLVSVVSGAKDGDLKQHRIAIVKVGYLLLNNKAFYKQKVYQNLLRDLITKLDSAIGEPKYVKELNKKVKTLRVVRIRWSVLRAFVKFLSLHKRAVITANHPSRLNFTIPEDDD
jgi:hypothetical protein